METIYQSVVHFYQWVAQNAHDWVAQYGDAGIFLLLVLGIVAFPIPDETVLTYAGYLVFKGRLPLIPTLVSGLLGSVCGITISYVLGRTVGLYLIRKYGRFVRITDEKINRAHWWYEHSGRWSLVFGYYVPGIRHLTAFVAGASKLEFPIFAVFAYIGGLIWSFGFIAVGYFSGKGWAQTSERIHHFLVIGSGIIVALLLFSMVFLWVRKRMRSRKNRIGKE